MARPSAHPFHPQQGRAEVSSYGERWPPVLASALLIAMGVPDCYVIGGGTSTAQYACLVRKV